MTRRALGIAALSISALELAVAIALLQFDRQSAPVGTVGGEKPAPFPQPGAPAYMEAPPDSQATANPATTQPTTWKLAPGDSGVRPFFHETPVFDVVSLDPAKFMEFAGRLPLLKTEAERVELSLQLVLVLRLGAEQRALALPPAESAAALLKSDCVAERSLWARLAAAYTDPLTRSAAIETATGDPNPGVRSDAIDALGTRLAEPGVEDAILITSIDGPLRPRARAIWYLGSIESPRSYGVISAALESEHEGIRRSARRAACQRAGNGDDNALQLVRGITLQNLRRNEAEDLWRFVCEAGLTSKLSPPDIARMEQLLGRPW